MTSANNNDIQLLVAWHYTNDGNGPGETLTTDIPFDIVERKSYKYCNEPDLLGLYIWIDRWFNR